MTMSTTNGLEELLREKAQLRNDLQSLYEEEKHLAQKLRMVEEKIAIHDLKEKINAKRAVVEQLRNKLTQLEKRWNSNVLNTISGFPPQQGELHSPREKLQDFP